LNNDTGDLGQLRVIAGSRWRSVIGVRLAAGVDGGIMRASFGLLCILVASCSSGMQSSTVGGGTAITTSVTVVTGGYAAMDEIPVEGGELRLAVPQIATFEDGPRRVIGFPLQHTAVTATVGGMMAVYEVEQTFANPFDEPIEAVYVFPLGDDGAVSGYELVIGERTIVGQIQTKEAARKQFDDARASGLTAGIVEQNKPNIFTQRIANIAPHETIKTKLRYVELLDYDDGSYTMAVPLTIGPRYLPSDRVGSSPVGAHAHGDGGRAGVTSIPYVDDARAASTVSFSAEIDAGVPIVDVESPSHDLVVTPVTPTTSKVVLGTKDLPNRDLIVRYKTAGPQTTVGLLAHRTDETGYFVLAVQPKATYRAGDIRPREVVLVIDRSGSMEGVPLQQAKAVASGIIDTLSDRDAFNVIAFASGVEAMSPVAVLGDQAGKQRGMQYLMAMQAGGGTEMEMGVQHMLATHPGNDRIRVVYFLTDGHIGNDDVVVGSAKKLLGTNRIFTIGVGSSPNRSLLDRLAAAGRGFASYLTLSESPDKLSKELVLKSAYPYLTDVSIDWGGLAVEDLTPAMVPDVFAGQPLVISGRYRKPGAATVKVTAMAGGRQITIPITVTLPAREDFEPVASLWARRKIEALLDAKDRGENPRGEITELGLRFHLVTDFTSFVAIDRRRVVSNGQPRMVEQPLVVPEGMSPGTYPAPSYSPPSRSSDDDDSSWGGWGGGSGGTREARELWLFVAVMLGVLWLVVRR
jgi:Ca-activated chloride channel family protein